MLYSNIQIGLSSVKSILYTFIHLIQFFNIHDFQSCQYNTETKYLMTLHYLKDMREKERYISLGPM